MNVSLEDDEIIIISSRTNEAEAGLLDVAERPLVTTAHSQIASRVIGGTSALGAGVLIERGAGLVANIMAARLGGTSTFGAYSLAISTANQISTYAAGGISATATRFSGKYAIGSRGYSSLARALSIVSFCSALLAAVALWLGAGSIAHLLGKQELETLLRWASLSAAGIVALECARGFFVGQRRLTALVLLSVLVGGSLVLLLPAAARSHSAIRMIILQGIINVSAVAICLILAKPLQLRATPAESTTIPLPAMLREVWSFGLVQLAGLVCSNAAGWWLTTLVARGDTTLVQMSFFAIASQLRNVAGIAPSLLTEGSYAVMADAEGVVTRTPHRVLAMCSYASMAVAMSLASMGIIVVPWIVTFLYGQAYAPAATTVAIGLAIAVVHMGNAPAAARLTIVSIRATGIINTVWAIFVAASATSFLVFGGGAGRAMTIYFAAHVLSSLLVIGILARKDQLPAGMGLLCGLGTVTSGSLVALAHLRAVYPGRSLSITLAMLALAVVASASLLVLGKYFRLLPPASAVRAAVMTLRTHLPQRSRHV